MKAQSLRLGNTTPILLLPPRTAHRQCALGVDLTAEGAGRYRRHRPLLALDLGRRDVGARQPSGPAPHVACGFPGSLARRAGPGRRERQLYHLQLLLAGEPRLSSSSTHGLQRAYKWERLVSQASKLGHGLASPAVATPLP